MEKKEARTKKNTLEPIKCKVGESRFQAAKKDSRYSHIDRDTLEKLAQRGFTLEQIAQRFGVDTDTIISFINQVYVAHCDNWLAQQNMIGIEELSDLIYGTAKNSSTSRQANIPLLIFLAKSRLRMYEYTPPKEEENTGHEDDDYFAHVVGKFREKRAA